MTEKGKQLTLSQRIRIEEMLNQRHRKFEIANELNKSQSTIAREINKHKKLKTSNPLRQDNMYNCKYFINCKKCTGKCKIFQPIPCKDRDRNIGVCSNCDKLKSCKLDKYFYIAEEAQKKYEYTLKDARQGVNLNTFKLIELAHLICPLIKKGQSIYTILNNHPEITWCEKAIYNYIEMGLFKDWDVTSLTLKRKVKRKVSKKKLKKRKQPENYEGRTYTDYLDFKIQNSNLPTTEMDTVYNHQSGPYIQTFIFENTSFMIGNGQSWYNLTQDKIDLMFSHINSTPRESLGGKTPYEIFTFIYGKHLANKLNIQEIAKDEVTTTPRLFK